MQLLDQLLIFEYCSWHNEKKSEKMIQIKINRVQIEISINLIQNNTANYD